MGINNELYYVRVDIKSPEDYPKKDGEYFCNRNGINSVQTLLANQSEYSYMREIRWYLKPVNPEMEDYGKFVKMLNTKSNKDLVDCKLCHHYGDTGCNLKI